MFICIQRTEERVIAHNQLEEKSIRNVIFNVLSSSWIRKTLAYVSSCHFNMAKLKRKKNAMMIMVMMLGTLRNRTAE